MLDKITGQKAAAGSAAGISGKFFGFESFFDYCNNFLSLHTLKGNILMASVGGLFGFFTKYVYDDILALVIIASCLLWAKYYQLMIQYRELPEEKRGLRFIPVVANYLFQIVFELISVMVAVVISHNMAKVWAGFEWLPGVVWAFLCGGYFLKAIYSGSVLGVFTKEFAKFIDDKFSVKIFGKKNKTKGPNIDSPG